MEARQMVSEDQKMTRIFSAGKNPGFFDTGWTSNKIPASERTLNSILHKKKNVA